MVERAPGLTSMSVSASSTRCRSERIGAAASPAPPPPAHRAGSSGVYALWPPSPGLRERLKQTGDQQQARANVLHGQTESPRAPNTCSQRPHGLDWEPGCLSLNASSYQTMALPSGYYHPPHVALDGCQEPQARIWAARFPESWQLDSRERTLGVLGECLS